VEADSLLLGDALELLRGLPDGRVDLVLTDPPYFLEGLDEGWDPEKVGKRTQSQAVSSLPSGMAFDPRQGRRLEDWYKKVSKEVYRVLKPGAFFLSFSSPRLVHRMGVAVEDAGF